MLGNIIPHLATLIVTVRKNVLSSIMTTFMILVIIIAWSARGNISSWLENNPSPQEQQERISRGGESDRKIEQALRQDLRATGADRVLIRQFHNQTSPEGNVIPYATTTHIVTAPGVSAPTPQIMSLPRSYLSDVTRRVWRPEPAAPTCTRLATADVTDTIYREYLERSGSHEAYICPITDLGGAPIGLIMATYLTPTKPRPSEEQIFTHLQNTATRIAGYLDEVTAPEREAWWRRLLGL